MKHIKFSAELSGTRNQDVKVKILEQTHIGPGFSSGAGDASQRFRASNGMELRSYMHPQSTTQNSIAVRGTYSSYHNDVITLTQAEYKRFKEAVIEYNTVFADKPAPSPCIVTIG